MKRMTELYGDLFSTATATPDCRLDQEKKKKKRQEACGTARRILKRGECESAEDNVTLQ